MSRTDVLVVGPAGHDTGGVAQYIAEQERVLPEAVRMRTFDVATPNGSGLAWILTAVLSALLDIVRFPLRERPDILHVHTSHYRSFYLSSGYVLFGALVWRVPVVVHVHGSSFDEFVRTASAPVAALQSAVFDHADCVVVLSGYWADVLSSRTTRETIRVLPNAVSPAAYDPRYDVDPPRLVFVSNHIERKGVVEFTDAVETLLENESTPAFEVVIAGTGPLAHHAEALAAGHEAVSYLGYVSEARKRELLNESSVYALPTHAEGLPIAILEAMAGGNAVVSTHVGSIPDLVGPENGELVEPGAVDSLTEALDRFLSDPAQAEAAGRTNRRLVEETYCWERVGDQLVALYDELEATGTDAGRPSHAGVGAGRREGDRYEPKE